MPYVRADFYWFPVLGLLNGGLEMAVEAVTGAETVWHSDIDPGACKILAHHWPDRRNLGDISAVDWAKVEQVDILAGGFPCQDVSAAGKRAGLIRYGEGNRSGLWAEMARAIDKLRPSLVVAENVRGLLSAKADAHPDVFDCLACVADASDKPMRALGAVLGDLAQLGYDAAWQVVRASDVGAPHQRARVFVIAWPSDTDRAGLAQWCQQPARSERATAKRGDPDAASVTVAAMLPTPSRSDGAGGPGDSGREGGLNLRTAVTLLPTPAASNPQEGESFETWEARRIATKERVGNGNGFGTPLTIAVQPERWGKYADAVERWERIIGPAPEPTETGPRGGQRLSPRFVEWMMGLPEGHVTEVPGLTRNEQLKALGNGVVPQQAEAALEILFNAVAVAA